jgi:hypothetical protein
MAMKEPPVEEFDLENPAQASALHKRLIGLIGKSITFDFPDTRGAGRRFRSTRTLKSVATEPADVGWGTYIIVNMVFETGMSFTLTGTVRITLHG